MKKIFSLVGGLLLATCMSVQAQQVNTLYFLENSPHRHYINPAQAPMSNFYLSLPAIGYTSFWSGTNGLALEDIIYQREGKTVLFMHPEYGNIPQFLHNLKPITSSTVDAQINLLSFGWRLKNKGYFHININERVDATSNVPKSIFDLALGGGFRDFEEANTYDLKGVNYDASVYTEFALGYSQPLLGGKLAIGGKAKFLYGHGYTSANIDEMNVLASAEDLSLRGSGHLQMAMPLVMPQQLYLNNMNLALPTLADGSIDVLEMIKPQGMGGAIDFGITYTPIKYLQISASVTDLGFMVWNKASRYDYSIDASYDGFGSFEVTDYYDVNTNTVDYDALRDTLNNRLITVLDNVTQVGERQENRLTRMLAPRLNVGIDANFWENRIGVGVYSRTKFAGDQIYEEVTLGAALRPAKWFQIAASYSFMNGKSSNIGAAIGIVTYEGIGLTLAADYVPCTYAHYDANGVDIPIPYKTQGLNLALGLNIVIGHNYDKDKDGVPNQKDLCPKTPKGVQVDENGCPVDTDGDGVPDYLDECPDTPAEARNYVDAKGCPTDVDGDSVPDYMDECMTEFGLVENNGCPEAEVVDSAVVEEEYYDEEEGMQIIIITSEDEEELVEEDTTALVPTEDWKDIAETPVASEGFEEEVVEELEEEIEPEVEEMMLEDEVVEEIEEELEKEATEEVVDLEEEVAEVVEEVEEKVEEDTTPKEEVQVVAKMLKGIRFNSGKATITPSSYAVLDLIAKIINENPDYLIQIQGYTDNTGTKAFNKRLSEQRARVVYNYLTKKGVDKERMQTTGRGATKPVASNKTAAGRAQNRRVDILLTPKAK